MCEDKRRTTLQARVVQNEVVQDRTDRLVQRVQRYTYKKKNSSTLRTGGKNCFFKNRHHRRNVPRQLANSESSSISHFHAQTVKNLSSCSSRACCPSVSRIEVNDPWVSYIFTKRTVVSFPLRTKKKATMAVVGRAQNVL
jgi:hypothetical protein